MIYTTYFSNIKNLPPDVIPVSICGKAPDWYTGLEFKVLAPKYNFFKVWKENHDNDYYISHFKDEVLSVLNPEDVVKGLLCTIGNFKGLNYHPIIALVCYEKPSEFCHRHLVADWLNAAGYECEELKKIKRNSH